MKRSDALWGVLGLVLMAPIAVLVQVAIGQGSRSAPGGIEVLLTAGLFLINFGVSLWVSMAIYTVAQALGAALVKMEVFTVVFGPIKWSAIGTPRLSWVGGAARVYGGSGYLVFGVENPTKAQLFGPMVAGLAAACLQAACAGLLIVITKDILFAGPWCLVGCILVLVSIVPYGVRGQVSPGSVFWGAVANPRPMLANLKCIWASMSLVKQGRPRNYDPSFLDRLQQDPELEAYSLYQRYAHMMDQGQILEAEQVCLKLIQAGSKSILPIKSTMLWDAAAYLWRYGSDRDRALWAVGEAQKSGPPPPLSTWRVVAARVKGDEEEARKQAELMNRDLKRLVETEDRRDYLDGAFARLTGSEIPMPLAGTGFFPLNL